MIKNFALLFLIYLMYVAVLFVFQRNFIYFPFQTRLEPEVFGLSDVKPITLHTADGLSLLAWYRPAKKDKPTMLYFHGNAGHIGSRGFLIKPYLEQGYGMLLTTYRGYSQNPGKPTEQGLYQDARAAMAFLNAQHIPARCIYVIGESLGSGVAVQIATEYPVGGVILQSPFTSLADVGQAHYFYIPVKWLLKDRFDSLSKIKNVHAPLLIVHGENDAVIPIKFGRKLFEAANEPKQLQVVSAGHNNVMASRQTIPFIEATNHCRS